MARDRAEAEQELDAFSAGVRDPRWRPPERLRASRIAPSTVTRTA
ncbi:hypothetical protein GCM10012275_05140 [Longimycelium tulufanense]|uniref:Uncharacterized protein n=1 Tax=Longimycelium tulufanense TaxID=907463 RepID=A0A8J3C685_9PSEU|nr:hypothetical protein [Longimycelium tulufanense]GGM36971.1 hypothetical protein GCM10012275_05140 [Longimycelium tulufanense]